VIFRVQVSASSSPVAEEKLRKELNLDQKISIIVVRAGRNFKYQAGEFADFDSASHLLKKLRDYGTKDAFVVAWFDGKQIEVEKARKMK
jgi:hypothetical protein